MFLRPMVLAGFLFGLPIQAHAAPKEIRDACQNCPVMVSIPHGRYQRGIPLNETRTEGAPPEYDEPARPVHRVVVRHDFYMAKHHTTVGDFRAFVARTHYDAGACWKNPFPDRPQSDTDPVVCVDYAAAEAFARWIGSQTKAHYRLPSEAEWEYAARAGTTASRYWGDNRADACGNANAADRSLARKDHDNPNDPVVFFPCDDGYAYTAPAGSFAPNGFGLHDMLGNAWQWTRDCWNPHYGKTPATDSAATKGDCDQRPIRGGSWSNMPITVRSGVRVGVGKSTQVPLIGFRLVRSAP